MEKLNWFKFSPSDWMMGKIQRCPEITQARFMRLCCLYWNKECKLTCEDAIIEIDDEHYKILLGKKIVCKKGKCIKIDFLDEQMSGVLDTSEKRRIAANKRWKGKEKKGNADGMQDDASALQSDAEKRRGEETREEKKRIQNIKDQFFTMFNDLKTKSRGAKSKHRKLSVTDTNNLNKHIKNKHTLNDFSIAISNMLKADWPKETGNDNPAHLLREDNFIKYLEQGDQTKTISQASPDFNSYKNIPVPNEAKLWEETRIKQNRP